MLVIYLISQNITFFRKDANCKALCKKVTQTIWENLYLRPQHVSRAHSLAWSPSLPPTMIHFA